MILTQRGVLPPVNFLELDASVRSSILGPAGTRLILPADLDATLRTTGTFTPTWTGFSAAPTGDWNYVIFGGIVTLYRNDGTSQTGTSNANSMQVTNLPAAIRPSGVRELFCVLQDNGVNLLQGMAGLTVGGFINFNLLKVVVQSPNAQYISSGFTAAGSKGLDPGFNLTYAL